MELTFDAFMERYISLVDFPVFDDQKGGLLQYRSYRPWVHPENIDKFAPGYVPTIQVGIMRIWTPEQFQAYWQLSGVQSALDLQTTGAWKSFQEMLDAAEVMVKQVGPILAVRIVSANRQGFRLEIATVFGGDLLKQTVAEIGVVKTLFLLNTWIQPVNGDVEMPILGSIITEVVLEQILQVGEVVFDVRWAEPLPANIIAWKLNVKSGALPTDLTYPLVCNVQ